MLDAVRLLVVAGPDQGLELILAPGEAAIIGRNIAVDFHLSDPLVGQRHCRIQHLETSIQVDDFGCINGVIVNGTRIVESITLDQDATLELGRTQLKMTVVWKRA